MHLCLLSAHVSGLRVMSSLQRFVTLIQAKDHMWLQVNFLYVIQSSYS